MAIIDKKESLESFIKTLKVVARESPKEGDIRRFSKGLLSALEVYFFTHF